MIGSILRSLIFLCISTIFLLPVYSEDTDYGRYSGNTLIQNDFSDYMTTLQGKIQKNWNPPDFLEEGDATVMFKVTRRGDVISAEIIKSSNDPVFDESTLEALKKAAPFDKFPANTTKDSLTIKYTFHTSIVKTDSMREHLEIADRNYNINNQAALTHINQAINEVEGDINSYFLYGKRSKIKRALGDIKGAEEDMAECKRLKEKVDRKRILSSKIIAEMENTPFSYFNLAHSYEIAGDYQHALEAIDKAIALTELNNQYKRYKNELLEKSNQ